MEPLFDPSEPKPAAQVRSEYDSAESVDDWILREVADYFGNGSDVEAAEAILDGDSEAFDTFLRGQYDEHEMVSLTVRIHRSAEQRIAVSAFREVPSPTTLLWLCCQSCDVDDVVVVDHAFANGTSVEITSTWPFGMHEAVMMTSPNPEGLHDEIVDAHDSEDFSEHASMEFAHIIAEPMARQMHKEWRERELLMVAKVLGLIGAGVLVSLLTRFSERRRAS